MLMKSFILVGTIISINFRANTLKITENVELNPAPYEILKSIQSSFNQINIAIFHETTCRQRACNVTSLSSIRKCSCWVPIDLDHILIEGYKI